MEKTAKALKPGDVVLKHDGKRLKITSISLAAIGSGFLILNHRLRTETPPASKPPENAQTNDLGRTPEATC
jgi:hypothetical protein